MERAVSHAIVGAAAAAVVHRAVPGAGPVPAIVGAVVAVAFHEMFDAPLAAQLRTAGL